MITIFDLIRHAETENNANFATIINGRSNHVKVTPKGYGEMGLLKRRFKVEQPAYDVIYTSPAVRTIELSRFVDEALDHHTPIIIDDNLQELHQGDWEGQPRAIHHTPEVIQKIIEMKGAHKAPNGESQIELEERAIKFMQNAADLHKGGYVAVCGHGLFFRRFLRYVEGWSHEEVYHKPMDNTSISQVVYDHEAKLWRMTRFNDAAHLTLSS